jgi:SAM-dependent methyltransferase
MTNRTHLPESTDWDKYYKQSPAAARFTRPITTRTLIRALLRYSVQNPILAELGGAGSCVLDSVINAVHPLEYHVVDINQYGLDLLRPRATADHLFLHKEDVRYLTLDVEVDTVFSLGLIEHFDPEGTRRAIEAHFRILKRGGIAIISFPTPTYLYRATRGAAELLGKWIFHDERPLRTHEVAAAIAGVGTIVSEEIIWPIFLTQTLLVVRKA